MEQARVPISRAVSVLAGCGGATLWRGFASGGSCGDGHGFAPASGRRVDSSSIRQGTGAGDLPRSADPSRMRGRPLCLACRARGHRSRTVLRRWLRLRVPRARRRWPGQHRAGRPRAASSSGSWAHRVRLPSCAGRLTCTWNKGPARTVPSRRSAWLAAAPSRPRCPVTISETRNNEGTGARWRRGGRWTFCAVHAAWPRQRIGASFSPSKIRGLARPPARRPRVAAGWAHARAGADELGHRRGGDPRNGARAQRPR